MSTNFYVKKNCSECGTSTEGVHLGKRSGGWKFLFDKSHGEFRDFGSLANFLEGKTVVAENGLEYTPLEFLMAVYAVQANTASSAGMRGVTQDAFGLEFANYDFS